MVDGDLSVDLEMFSRGGLAVLDAIEASGYDTLHHRPAIGKGKQARLLAARCSPTLVKLMVFRVKRRGIVCACKPAIAALPSAAVTSAAATAEIDIATSYEACHQIARAARSNFYYAFYLLPETEARWSRAALCFYAPSR